MTKFFHIATVLSTALVLSLVLVSPVLAAGDLCVAGFADTNSNGTYSDWGFGTVAGQPVWTNGTDYICSSGGGSPRWYLGVTPSTGCGVGGSGSTVNYYQDPADVSATPDTFSSSVWQNNGGGTPTGTVTAGACSAPVVPTTSTNTVGQYDFSQLMTVVDSSKPAATDGGQANVSSDVIGTPFNQDVTIEGFTYFEHLLGDGTVVGQIPVIKYADAMGGVACTSSSSYTTNAMGSTTVDLYSGMVEVFIPCVGTIDHNRPLRIVSAWISSGVHQTGAETLGNGIVPYYQISFDGSYSDVGSFGRVVNKDVISSVVPLAGSSNATSTQFYLGASGSISTGSFVPDHTNVDICLNRANTQNQADIFAPTAITTCLYEAVLPINSSGVFNVQATTTILDTGGYFVHTSVTTPLLSAFGFGFGSKIVVATSTVFGVGTLSADDQAAIGQLNVFQQTGGVTAIVGTSSPCSVGLNFNVGACALGFFVPSPSDMSTIKNYSNQLLSKPPWGYAYRIVGLVSGSASTTQASALSTTLPSLNVQISDTHLPGTTGLTSLNLTPWNDLMGSGSILSTATSTTGATFRSIVEPGWDFLIGFLFAIAMLNRVLGLGFVHGAEVQSRNLQRQGRGIKGNPNQASLF